MVGNPSPRRTPWRPPADRPARILLVRLSALGDVLHALPVLTGLRRRLPEARIDWLVEDRAADLVRARPEVDRVVVFPRRELEGLGRRPARLARRALALRRELRAGAYDVALDLQGNLKSGVLTRLSGAHIRFGGARQVVREGNHLFTNRRTLPPAAARHRVERNLALLGALLGEPVPWTDPGWPRSESAVGDARALVDDAGLPAEGYALLHPGTSGFGSFKRWPADRFADLAVGLVERGVPVAMSAPPAEAELARAVVREARGLEVPVLETSDLGVLAELIRAARLFVAADTGPLHLAALTGTPVVGLFGPKDPAVYGPYGLREDGRPGVLRVAARDDVACRPCTLRACADPVCMRGLAPDLVLARCLELVGPG